MHQDGKDAEDQFAEEKHKNCVSKEVSKASCLSSFVASIIGRTPFSKKHRIIGTTTTFDEIY